MTLRIGTWNLDGKSSPAHDDLLAQLACDVLLLTEFQPRGLEKHWAAIKRGRDDAVLDAPGSPTVRRQLKGIDFICSVLPWRDSQRWMPTPGANQGECTSSLVSEIDQNWQPQTVWGGDWNHELTGHLHAGSTAGRAAILDMVVRRKLQVPTIGLASQQGGASIDHIAVPNGWSVLKAERHPAARLSDHDAYVVEVVPT